MNWNFTAGGRGRCVPKWLADREPPLRINELTRKAVIFLGIQDDLGGFGPYGTAFIVGWEFEGGLVPYLVTAKHVIDDMRATKRPMVGRINTVAGSAELGVVGHWKGHPTHPNVDIMVAPLAASRDTFDFRAVGLNGALTEEYIKTNDVGCGDAVYMCGLLTAHFGRSKNIPVVRIGNIAAMSEEPIDFGGKMGVQEAYLIECRSIGGLSGSPVFLQTPPYRIIDTSTHHMEGHQREYLMGVNIGLFETGAHADKLAKEPDVSDETAERRKDFLEAMSSGMAVVIPIQRVIEIIENDVDMKKHRETMVERAKNTGFKPTSAKAVEVASPDTLAISPPANGENPSHQEDFRRLVSLAARKPESKD